MGVGEPPPPDAQVTVGLRTTKGLCPTPEAPTQPLRPITAGRVSAPTPPSQPPRPVTADRARLRASPPPNPGALSPRTPDRVSEPNLDAPSPRAASRRQPPNHSRRPVTAGRVYASPPPSHSRRPVTACRVSASAPPTAPTPCHRRPRLRAAPAHPPQAQRPPPTPGRPLTPGATPPPGAPVFACRVSAPNPCHLHPRYLHPLTPGSAPPPPRRAPNYTSRGWGERAPRRTGVADHTTPDPDPRHSRPLRAPTYPGLDRTPAASGGGLGAGVEVAPLRSAHPGPRAEEAAARPLRRAGSDVARREASRRAEG